MIFLHCTRYKEPAPFFDGLYLKYHEVFGKSENPEDIIWTRDIEYRFRQLEGSNFHISQVVDTKRDKNLDVKIEPTPYPQVGADLTIDQQGNVLKGGNNFYFVNGYPVYLWLPPDKRKVGTEVITAIRKVEEKTKWKGRDVWPVKGMLGDTYYYDLNTGFLIGAENLKGKLKMTLTDTNFEKMKSILK